MFCVMGDQYLKNVKNKRNIYIVFLLQISEILGCLEKKVKVLDNSKLLKLSNKILLY